MVSRRDVTSFTSDCSGAALAEVGGTALAVGVLEYELDRERDDTSDDSSSLKRRGDCACVGVLDPDSAVDVNEAFS